MKFSNLLIILSFSFLSVINAQDEVLSPIGNNAALRKYEVQTKASLAFNNIVITTDTLSLPFIDDFSTPTLPARDFSNFQFTDSSLYASGSCVIDGDFTLFIDSFSTVQTYVYFYDTLTDLVDSIVTASLQFEFYNGPNCFPIPSTTASYYPQVYSYSFDSVTGARLDSILLPVDTSFQYAEIYFALLGSDTKWVDNYAFQNTTFPINPPTIGVATLDGLNEFGRPYNNTVVNPVGYADIVTSKPIDLSAYHNDSAVFISFFIQATGIGDVPNIQDSLVLEFKNEYENLWVKVWGINIEDVVSNDFKQYYVALRDTNLIAGPRYFYPNFQFRFRNIASLSGNNDHWHIDYIRLDRNRALVEQDTVIRDVAFLYDFPNSLSKYSMLPWSQFQAGADSFAAEIEIPIRDNGQINGVSAGSFPISVLVTDSLDSDTIFQLSGLNFNPTAEIKIQPFSPISDFVKPNFDGDSICMNSGMGMYPTARNLIFSNDTIFSQICFDKVMAYDDGSAERAYGLSGSPNEIKKFAYKFEVSHPDTLAAIQIHFSNIDEDVSNLVFSFYAWDSLEIDQPLSYENVIGTIENKKPTYINIQNGFVTFAFDTPILVTNTFYIGWAQTDTRNLQIGFDKNSTKGRVNMFTYTGSTWRASTISEQGSPMLRAVLDANFVFEAPTGITNISSVSTISVYPNPSSGVFTLMLPKDMREFQTRVFDLSGKLIHQSNNQLSIDLSEYNTGMYLLQTQMNGQIFRAKLIKN
jgi:hypothetical protein